MAVLLGIRALSVQALLLRAAIPVVFGVSALGCSGADSSSFGKGQGGGGGSSDDGDQSSAEATTATGTTATAAGTAQSSTGQNSSAQTGPGAGGDDASSTGPGQGGANEGGANQGGGDPSGPGGGGPGCGDRECDDSESCEDCPEDCGACPDTCGDDACSDGETCETCEEDCGPCADECEEHDDCDDDEICADGTCEDAFGRTYVFTVVSGTFPANNPALNSPWDPIGPPDPFVEICTSDACPAGTTTTNDDVSTPTWNETFSQVLDDGPGEVWFTMWDEDFDAHDFALETPLGSGEEWIQIVRNDDGIYAYQASPGLSLTISVRPM